MLQSSITEILPSDAPSGKFRVEVEIVEDLHQLVRADSLATIRCGVTSEQS